MKSWFHSAIIATVLAFPAQAQISGTISLSAPDYAAIYGVEVPADGTRAYWAPAGTFCGISKFSDLLNFQWTGFMYGYAVLYTSPTYGIWVFSCINPAGVREVLLYSDDVVSTRGADEVDGVLPGDEPWVQALEQALGNMGDLR